MNTKKTISYLTMEHKFHTSHSYMKPLQQPRFKLILSNILENRVIGGGPTNEVRLQSYLTASVG